MLTILRVAWARVYAFLRPGDSDRDLAEELEAHLALAEEEKIRQGMDPVQARRMARVELGGMTQLRAASRDARGLPWLDTFWLDIKLSFRMLRKSWGLTLVGGLAMTIAISVGVMIFWLLETVYSPTLPLEQGDRVIAIQTWDEKNQRIRNTAGQDLERWRDSLQSVEDFGSFRTIERNLAIGDGLAEPVYIAEMTASGFQLARTPPLMGRTLVEQDERDGSKPVVVIGYDVWQTRFSADPAVIGQTLRLGGVIHTVVGVMPQSFRFPVAHDFWTPFPVNRAAYLGKDEESITFARLVPGATLDSAQAELKALGVLPPIIAPTIADGAELDERIYPRVVPYTFAFIGDAEYGEVPWVIRITLLLITLLLVPPCANIAILVYARTISRQAELASRFVLGASRGRIVGQLFIEVLVLAAGAAGMALMLTSLAGVYLRNLVTHHASNDLPFWINFDLSLRAVLVAAGLGLVAATIAGLIPALKATGRQMQSGLHALGNRSSLQLGMTWTVLVVAQVALTLAALPSAMEMGWGTIRKGILGPGFASENFLTAELTVDREIFDSTAQESDDRPFPSRFAALQEDLARQLTAEPGVIGVTFAAEVPGEESWAKIEIDGVTLEKESVFEDRSLVRFNHVDSAFFDVFDVPVLAGRGFEVGDLEPSRAALIVNQTFAQQVFGGNNPLGHRIRYTRILNEDPLPESEPAVWYEIVGVVADVPKHVTRGTIYHPMTPGQVHPTSLALRAGLNPVSLSERLRQITTTMDPALQVEEVVTLEAVYKANEVGNNMGAFSLVLVTLSVLLLSAAGIYALMSFTVNQRRREIGIRSALGAQPSRVLAGIFNRAIRQVGAGVTIGALVALLLDYYLPIEAVGGWNIPGIIPGAAAFMLFIGLVAASGPARRGLQVNPIEELREG